MTAAFRSLTLVQSPHRRAGLCYVHGGIALITKLHGDMRRRDFIMALGGAAAWPMGSRAQHGERIRRVGVLMNLPADDPEASRRIGAFLQELQQLGWTLGRNLQIDVRWGGGNADRYRRYAAELVSLAPDLILASASASMMAVQQATDTIPIVFVVVVDPVGAGFVASLARPGGNATGFTQFEYGLSGKYLELLKDIAPRITRAVVIRDPTTVAGTGQLGALRAAAAPMGIELVPVGVRDGGEIERAIAAFAQQSNGGLIVTGGGTAIHRDLIIGLAIRHRLPAVYPYRYYTSSGGLMSYGPDLVEHYRRAAGYVDRILKGEKPADLPVEQALKFELVINLKTAKALGLEIPPMLLARADEVIE
jgi:putative tryptophan/tyrosine transport system substrate-binding protein